MRVYGPVPSRRFGLSLGVDLVPRKTCPFDCVYCQLGPTDRLTATCERFFRIEEVLQDVEQAVRTDPKPEVITLAGSGEPTLYEPLEELIDGLREISEIPVLLITNGALLWKESVARASRKVDILAPSLDAGDEELFQRINRPHPDVTFDRLLGGLRSVVTGHPGEVRLEVMLVRAINDHIESLRAIARALAPLPVDQIDVNTPVRTPGAAQNALVCDQETLERALDLFGPKARAIGIFDKKKTGGQERSRTVDDLDRDIREILLRRPCTADDIASSLGVQRDQVEQSLERLIAGGFASSRSSEKDVYYHPSTAASTALRNGRDSN